MFEIMERELTLLSRHYLHVQSGDQTLERSAYVLLGRLEISDPMTLKELAGAFALDVSTINRQIASLQRHGLVERTSDPDGGMARRFRPTPAGLEKLARDRELNADGVKRVVGGWSVEDMGRLTELLTRFNREIEALEGRPWPR
ncbi:MarR family winged helix-turn-helix transcriptional regulator [Paenarthrobacter sp. PH39-S1]|uniref:MarR family winged helix-turn-helix transcriptional regulator n=1 Tax=Micrococcaceae TaxID=1268 RepID=UPI0024B8C460|nr:MarR family winged helix-turn-helix transcriptional regulator [Paenarthrobacter sp. PH39-S1]MDJ0354795.1 MarR family winged helix-turn-helix transcriptional regulator [Paenarthrobacter sp. PH39-S1]